MKEEPAAFSDQELSQLVLESEATLGTVGSLSPALAERLRKFSELYEAVSEKPVGAALLYRQTDKGEVNTRTIDARLVVGRLSRSGRNPSGADLAFADAEMSRIHFEITCAGGLCTLRDLDSRNGTLLNGERLSSPSALKAGDMISAGQTIFMFTGS